SGLLDRVGFGGLAGGLELRLPGAIVEDEVLHEPARLDVGQNALPLGLGLAGDDPRAGGDVAVFGGVGARIAHVGDPAFIEQVDDQLGLVQALEIGHLRSVAGLDQRLKPGLDQVGDAAAEHGLFAEEVGFALFLEVGLDDAAATAADAGGVGEGDVVSVAA